jgi:hypothetical protein
MGPRRSPPLYIIAPIGGALALAASAAHAGTPCSSCSPPPPPPCNCTPTTHQVKIPGVTIMPPQINIGLPAIGVGFASASSNASANASVDASTNVSVQVNGAAAASSQNAAALFNNFGGGSGSFTPEASVTTEIPDVKVETIQVAAPPPLPLMQQICAEWKSSFRQIAVQATCLDDKAIPHPASQLSPDRTVAPTYEGEVFRCIAGARMQYTIADFTGQADFNHGQTIVCQKGEALYHSAAGGLQCKAQIPQRDCNERSLLRRFGAGIKVLTVSGAQICANYRTQAVAMSAAPAPPSPAGPMVLN